MTGRPLRLLLAALLVLATGGCGTAGAEPERFARVDLPAGAAPDAIAAAGDDLLVGVRRAGAPGLVRRTPGGASSEVPLAPATPYGRTAGWYSIASDGRRILGIGGDRGGAHGNVRWSVWTGSGTGVAERIQAFSTFGGWGAGDLVDAVLTPAGSALVGSWQSDRAGLDVAVWTPAGDTWTRQSSTGTPLASTPDALGFATGATASGSGIVIAGWQFVTGPRSGQIPVVWRRGATGWTRTPLPGAGTSGAAVGVRCGDAACAVSGRVDGRLALWRSAGEGWERVPGVPPIAVGDTDPLPAPLEIDGRLAQVVSGGGQVSMVEVTGTGAAVRPVAGPTGSVTSAVLVGGSLYLLAGPDEGSRAVWAGRYP